VLSRVFSVIPATGAIAGTASNVMIGGRTPVSGIVHAVVLLLFMVFFGQWAALIPMATLAAILIVVAYNMSEWHSFVRTFRSPKSDVAVMLVTFFLTVIVDLTAAIQIGVILSAILFIRRMAQVSQVNVLTRDLEEGRTEDESEPATPIPEGVEVFEVYGSLFFGAVEQFNESIRSLRKKPKVFILETRNLLAIDATGLRAIEDLVRDLSGLRIRFILSGLHKQPLFALQQAGILDLIGEDNLCGTLQESLDLAGKILETAGTEKKAP
jgi:SulP family sulfate permease